MTAPVLGTYPFLPSINADPDVVASMTSFLLGMLYAYKGLAPPVLAQRGERITTSALKTKYAIAVGSPLFKLMTGGVEYREVGNLMLEVAVPDPWADAVKALVQLMQSNEWTGWGDQPAMMGEAANLIGEKAIVRAILAGETTPSADNFFDGDSFDKGYRFFMQARPCDPLGNNSGVKSNLFTGAGTAALNYSDAAAPMNLSSIERVYAHIKKMKAQNGEDFMDLIWKAVLVSNADEVKARRYFDDQGDENREVYEPVVGGTTADSKFVPIPNTARKYKIEVIASRYLPDDGSWYPVCETAVMKKWPWVEITQVPKNQVPFAGAQPGAPGSSTSNGAGDIVWTIDAMDSHNFKHGAAGSAIPKGYVGIAAQKRVGASLLYFDQLFKCKAA